MIASYRGYKNKYYIPFQFLSCFAMLADALISIVLLPTPYQCRIWDKYLKATIHKQMAKRLRLHKQNTTV